MSTIDQVIARSRRPGGFQERKRFSVARQRAIRKMRQFALADPHYYVLELIQAAVANRATHVDLRCEKKSFGMSYIGGGFIQEELAQLFDFLFASKEDFAHGDIRQLALGVNALMIMEPARIVIESGDGSMGGTTRIELNSSENTVDVGTPEEALRGTFVRAEGLKRSKVRGKSNLKPTDYGPRECMAIENRCLAAPVPIIVNDHPVFGYSSLRTPTLFGYRNVVTFDEGDLYGSIGIAQQAYKRTFKLLTWGAWVQSVEQDIAGYERLGGIVAYDRLNKTADHSGIVKDERLAEMFARLQPYAHKVMRGKTGKATFQIAPLGGEFLEPKELRDDLHAHGTAVVVPPMLSADGPRGRRAREIGHVLDALVLTVDDEEMSTLRNLAGSRVRLLRPDLTNPDELAFFKRDTDPPPPRPWIIGAAELSGLSVQDFVELLVAEQVVSPTEQNIEELTERLGSSGELSGTIYTPVGQASDGKAEDRELWVRVRTVDRVVWEGAVTSAYPGHVLDIDVPAVSPSALLASVSGGMDVSLARLIAEVVARHAVGDLEECARRALESLAQFDIEPGSTGARVALAALARGAIKRLRSTGAADAAPAVRFSLVDDQPNLDLLDLPVFETLDGRAMTMRDLAAAMEETHGLVYGVVPEVEPDLRGLDQSLILDLDLECERLLMQIVGEGAYVRVDRRDVIVGEGARGRVDRREESAERAKGRVRIRDVALGLREYADDTLLAEGSMLAEGGSLQTLDEDVVEHLVTELVAVFGGASPGFFEQSDEEFEEIRRQAVRHLQYFVCRRALANDRSEGPDRPTYGVEEMGLFLDGHGRAVSLDGVRRGFSAHGRLVMVDGRSSDVCELGVLRGGEEDGEATDEPPRSLMMNSWVFGLLSPFGELAGAFDFDLTDAEAADVEVSAEAAFVASSDIDGERISGRLGLPEEPVEDPSIAVVSSESQRVFQLRQPAIDYGVVGLIKVDAADVEERWEQIYAKARRAGWQILSSLVDRLAELHERDDYERVLGTLFDFAGRHLHLARRPDGAVVCEIDQGLAQRILDVPVFSTRGGLPVSGQRLINEFCIGQTRGGLDDGVHLALADDIPRVLVDWVDRHLRPHNVVRPAAGSAGVEIDEAPSADKAADGGTYLDSYRLAKFVQRWLRALRPDDHARQLAHSNADAAGVSPRGGIKSFQLRVIAVDPDDARAVGELDRHDVRQAVEAMEDGDAFAYTTGRPPVLVVNAAHQLARRAADHGGDPRPLAWLLLAAYSHVNALLEPVTNDHELAFQRRLADVLQEGGLVLPSPVDAR